jgi:hypothetical protein
MYSDSDKCLVIKEIVKQVNAKSYRKDIVAIKKICTSIRAQHELKKWQLNIWVKR